MVGEWSGRGVGIAEVEQHQDFLIFGKTEERVKFVGVEAVDPTRIDTGICCGEHHMRRHYRGILNARFTLSTGICVYILLIESHYEHSACPISAGSAFIDFCQGFI